MTQLSNLRRCEPHTLELCSESAALLSFVRLNFPLNELTAEQWRALESVADLQKKPTIAAICTFRLCQKVEFCPENGLFFLVTRYLEIHPESRRILPKKTVKPITTLYPIEMYLKSYHSVRKF